MTRRRFKPCVDCGARVPVACESADDTCGPGVMECSDCAMMPALCRDCAIRGLIIAVVGLAAILLAVVVAAAAGALCR